MACGSLHRLISKGIWNSGRWFSNIFQHFHSRLVDCDSLFSRDVPANFQDSPSIRPGALADKHIVSCSVNFLDDKPIRSPEVESQVGEWKWQHPSKKSGYHREPLRLPICQWSFGEWWDGCFRGYPFGRMKRNGFRVQHLMEINMRHVSLNLHFWHRPVECRIHLPKHQTSTVSMIRISRVSGHAHMWSSLIFHMTSGLGAIGAMDWPFSIPFQVRQKYGVEANHAYSLMKCFEEKLDNGQAIRLVQIRNPWGFGEWNGDWADYSKGKLPDCWEKNPELKKRLKVKCFFLVVLLTGNEGQTFCWPPWPLPILVLCRFLASLTSLNPWRWRIRTMAFSTCPSTTSSCSTVVASCALWAPNPSLIMKSWKKMWERKSRRVSSQACLAAFGKHCLNHRLAQAETAETWNISEASAWRDPCRVSPLTCTSLRCAKSLAPRDHCASSLCWSVEPRSPCWYTARFVVCHVNHCMEETWMLHDGLNESEYICCHLELYTYKTHFGSFWHGCGAIEV